MKHFTFFKKASILILLFIFFDFLISVVLLNGLNKFYGFSQNPEILINGSSMAMSGFNRKEIENLTGSQISTYAQEGVSVVERSAMIKHFFQMYPDGVKTVIYELNPVLLSNVKSAENVYTLFYPFMDDKTIDNYIKEISPIKEYYINKIIRTKRFDSRMIRLIMMGYLNKYDNLKTNTLDTTTLLQTASQKGETKVIMEKSNVEIFESSMDFIRSHNSRIVLVMMPMYHLKLHGFDKDGYRNLCNYFEDYCSSKEGVKYLDLNQDSLILNVGYFSDPLHFNVYGQRTITNIICSYLDSN